MDFAASLQKLQHPWPSTFLSLMFSFHYYFRNQSLWEPPALEPVTGNSFISCKSLMFSSLSVLLILLCSTCFSVLYNSQHTKPPLKMLVTQKGHHIKQLPWSIYYFPISVQLFFPPTSVQQFFLFFITVGTMNNFCCRFLINKVD